MNLPIFEMLLIPFLGTTLGAGCVFFMRDRLDVRLEKALTGFAGGVMVAASVWSLLIPAIDEAAAMGMGKLACVPAAIGFLIGIFFLLALDMLIPHLHMDSKEPEGPRSQLKDNILLVLAVTLHNIPEGMTVGVVIAGWLSGQTTITLSGAMALAIGIAIQNFPEGAIISMPLKAEGMKTSKAFLHGFLSGAVEPIAALVTLLLANIMLPILPYLLSFAAGAMVYVVVEELIPEASRGKHSNLATIAFALGFVLMMVLDVALG